MTDTTKIETTHLQRVAIIYLRQSTTHQLEYNRESTQRQYALVDSRSTAFKPFILSMKAWAPCQLTLSTGRFAPLKWLGFSPITASQKA